MQVHDKDVQLYHNGCNQLNSGHRQLRHGESIGQWMQLDHNGYTT
jgi:hypothetical protein